MRSRRKLWAGLIILFGAGTLTGIVAGYVYSHTERTTEASTDLPLITNGS